MNVYGRTYKYDYPVFHTADIPYRHTLINNTPVPGILNPDTVYKLQDFQFRDGDIVVASYQKAGSIILRVMIQMLLGLSPMQDAFHWLEVDGNIVKQEAQVLGHRLLRTHLPFDWLPKTDSHVTYLFLYPADPDFILSLYSHFHTSTAIGYTGDWDTFFRLWTSEKVFYGSFYKHRESWISKHNNIDVIVWPYIRDQVDKEMVERIAAKVLPPLPPQTQSPTHTVPLTVDSKWTTSSAQFSDNGKQYSGCENSLLNKPCQVSEKENKPHNEQDHSTSIKDAETADICSSKCNCNSGFKEDKDTVFSDEPTSNSDDITQDCADDKVITRDDVTMKREALISEVFEYIFLSNPLAVWRTDRERKMLEGGLAALIEDHRKRLEAERLRFD